MKNPIVSWVTKVLFGEDDEQKCDHSKVEIHCTECGEYVGIGKADDQEGAQNDK